MPHGTGERALESYVALLRAVNVASRNAISMGDLRALVEALGFEDVRTYVQSGNVVFKGAARDHGEVGRTIEDELERRLGLRVAVLLRGGGELAEILAGNPFVSGGTEPARLHVTFLSDVPDPVRVLALDPGRSPPDELRVAGREVYLHCPDGYGRSKLTNAYIERALGVAATTRNWNTVTKLAELAGG
jgi:uncharacterized protein (DUF1697 family)